MNDQWEKTLNHILIETEDVHRLYSEVDGWCILTAKNTQRFRINDTMTLEEVKQIIQQVKQINAYGPTASRRAKMGAAIHAGGV